MSAFIEAHHQRFGVEPICRTLEVSASACCERATGRRSTRSVEDERLLERIKEVHERNCCAYGYRRTSIVLKREGEEVGRGRVQRLMRQAGIQGAKRRGKPWRTTTPDPTAERRPDLVQRDFSATAPNRLWVGDFTYLRSWEGISCFSFVIDAFSRKVVGWQLACPSLTSVLGCCDGQLNSPNTPRPTAPRSSTTPAPSPRSLGDRSPVEFEDLYVREEVQLSNIS